jgi:hypothetical protein
MKMENERKIEWLERVTIEREECENDEEKMECEEGGRRRHGSSVQSFLTSMEEWSITDQCCYVSHSLVLFSL